MTLPTRVLFTGSRSYADLTLVEFVVEGFFAQYDGATDLTVIHGDCPTGADALVDQVARALGPYLNVTACPADWPACDQSHPHVPCPASKHRRQRLDGSEYCPLAGLRRNQDMLSYEPDLVVAFVDKPIHQSKGTDDMCRRAAAAHIPVHVLSPWK